MKTKRKKNKELKRTQDYNRLAQGPCERKRRLRQREISTTPKKTHTHTNTKAGKLSKKIRLN